MPSIVCCLCCERESAKFTGRTLSVLGRHADRAPFNEAASEFASTWLSNGTYHAFGEAMLRTSAARQMLPLSNAGVTISDVSCGFADQSGKSRAGIALHIPQSAALASTLLGHDGGRLLAHVLRLQRSGRDPASHKLTFSLCMLAFAQWPSANSNGYAFYHRVDRVNGGDENATHTTGFGKKQRFWYK